MTTTTTGERTGLRWAGIVVLIVGLLAGIGLWILSGQRESDAVRDLARAPIGCDTTLDFEAGGEYFIFIESAGRFDESVSGDCGAVGDYDVPANSVPPVTLTLTAPDGGEVALESSAGIAYDAAGYVGQSVRTFTVDATGDHRLRVESPGSSDVAVAAAVGRDPSDGVGSMRLGAALAALAGLIVGALLIRTSRRAVVPEIVTPDGPWSEQPAGWPTSPPGMPVAPPSGGQDPLGPPTQYPAPPSGANDRSASSDPTQLGESAPPPPPPPQQGFGGAPAEAPTWGSRPFDGSSGDGQRSPWAPPSDSAQ